MKKTQLISVLSFLLVVMFATTGCQQSPDTVYNPQTDKGLLFVASQDEGSLRAVSGKWESADEIGLFVKPSAAKDWSNLKPERTNLRFQTRQSGATALFEPFGEADKIHLQPSEEVDILAYYPYNSAVDASNIVINIENQSDPRKVDFLYSDNLVTIDNHSKQQQLIFRHALSKLSFTVTSQDGYPLDGLDVTYENFFNQGAFNLFTRTWTIPATNVGSFKGKVELSADKQSAKVSAFILPSNRVKGMTVVMTLPNGKVYKWGVRPQKDKPFEMGTNYHYTIRLKGDTGVEVDPETVAYKELPEYRYIPNTQKVMHYIRRNDTSSPRNFIMLYNTQYKLAQWVAYPMHKSYLGNSGRTDAWNFDPDVKQGMQPNLKKSYSGSYDRGHQVASSDRTVSKEANRMTFYYTNLTPQQADLNQGVWNKLELAIQGKTKNIADTIYVVTGAFVDPNGPNITTRDGAGKTVTVPHNYFKVLAMKDRSGTFHTVGYWFPNKAGLNRKDPYDKYKKSVAEIEALTGFTFFPYLSKETKQKADLIL